MMRDRRLLLSSMTLCVAAALSFAGREKQHAAAAPVGPSDQRLLVTWVFRPDGFLACRSPASALRHLTSDFQGRVRIVAYGVGVDAHRAHAMLRRERLDVELVTGSADGYRRVYAANAATGIHIVRDGRVVQSFEAGPSNLYPSVGALRSAVQHLLAADKNRGTTAPR